MISLPKEMVLASAGSGKTFHLSSRLIGILALGEKPEAVWASTFTRKAAGEILERVLLRLAQGAMEAEKAEELADFAWMGDPQSRPSDFLNQDHCGRLLLRFLQSLHRTNLGTLDSFFFQVSSSFAEELGFPPGWHLVERTDEDRMRSEALDAVLALHDPLVTAELVRIITKGEVRRRVHAHLLEQVDDLLRLHRAADSGSEDTWVPELAGVSERDTRSREDVHALCDNLAAELEGMEPPLTKAGTPRKNWTRELPRLAGVVRARDWSSVFETGLGRKLVEGGELRSPGDVVYDGHSPGPELSDVLNQIVGLAREDMGRALIRQGRALGRMAGRFREVFEAAQEALGSYRFEDITHHLGRTDPLRDTEALYFRLDARIRHLLLDEFQDTSLPQWQVLEPLMEEILSQGGGDRAAVLVADPKQSIYGWRGARPGLVDRVRKRHQLTSEKLNESFRSGPVVLDTVAAVFEDIALNPVICELSGGPEVAGKWLEDFYQQKAHYRHQPGYACMVAGPPPEGRGGVQAALLDHVASLIGELAAREPRASIGILVRTNKVVSYLMAALRQVRIPASGEGGTPLTDAAPVNAILALLTVADHPGDRLARYHVAHTPVGEVVGFTNHKNETEARRLAVGIRGRLLREGYGRVLEGWVRELEGFCDEREWARLRQMVELGFRWDCKRTLRPSDFVRFVEGEGVEDPSGSRVRVMTVHQAKGLEFDVVVLPSLYDSLEGKGGGPPVLPLREDDSERVIGVFPAVDQATRALFPELREAHRQERAASLRDELSNLYVAMTRARYAIHMVVPGDGEKPSKAKSGARILREALAPGEPADLPGNVLFEKGSENWSQGLTTEDFTGGPSGLEAGSPGVEAPASVHLGLSRGIRTRNLARKSPSSLEGGNTLDLATHLRRDLRGKARLRGEVVHAWCEELEWVDDGWPDDATLLALGLRVAPGVSEERLREWLSDFRVWTANPAIIQTLRRGSYPTGSRVERELPILHRIADGILQGYVDRVVLMEEGGRVVGAEVLDFKTDQLDGSDESAVQEKVAFYKPQIDAYREAVAGKYGLNVIAVTGKLLFLRPGVVSGL